MAIAEQDALILWRGLEGAEPAQRDQALDVLRRYQKQQDDAGLPLWPETMKADSERRAKVRGMFSDLETLGLGPEDQRAANEWADYSEDPAGDRARLANTAWLSQVLGESPQTVSERYPLLRDEVAVREFGVKPGIDDVGLYHLIANSIRQEKEGAGQPTARGSAGGAPVQQQGAPVLVPSSPEKLREVLATAGDRAVYTREDEAPIEVPELMIVSMGSGYQGTSFDGGKLRQQQALTRQQEQAAMIQQRRAEEARWRGEIATLMLDPSAATGETLQKAMDAFEQGHISQHVLNDVFATSGVREKGTDVYLRFKAKEEMKVQKKQELIAIMKGSEESFHRGEGADPRLTVEYKAPIREATAEVAEAQRRLQALEQRSAREKELEPERARQRAEMEQAYADRPGELSHRLGRLDRRDHLKVTPQEIEAAKKKVQTSLARLEAVRYGAGQNFKEDITAMNARYEEVLRDTDMTSEEKAGLTQQALFSAAAEVPRDFMETWSSGEFWTGKVPFVGGFAAMAALLPAAVTVEKLSKGDTVSQEELAVLHETLVGLEREPTLMAQVLETTVGSLSFGVELATTAGIYSAAKGLSLELAEAGLKKLLTKGGVEAAEKLAARYGREHLAARTLGGLIGEAVRTPFASAGHIAQKYVTDYTSEGVAIHADEHDRLVASLDQSEREGSTWDRLRKAYLSSVVENASEAFGKFLKASGANRALGEAMEQAFAGIPPKVKAAVTGNALVQLMRKLNPNLSEGQLGAWLRRANVDSLPEELSEEVVGAFGQSAVTGEPLRMPTKEDVVALTISMLLPGAGSAWSQYRASKRETQAQRDAQSVRSEVGTELDSAQGVQPDRMQDGGSTEGKNNPAGGQDGQESADTGKQAVEPQASVAGEAIHAILDYERELERVRESPPTGAGGDERGGEETDRGGAPESGGDAAADRRFEGAVRVLRGNEGERKRHYEALSRWASEKGRIFASSRLGTPVDSRGEHSVHHAADQPDLVYKVTHAGWAGLIPRAVFNRAGTDVNVTYDDATPKEYLNRVDLWTKVFGARTAPVFVGVVEGASPALVVSQPWLRADNEKAPHPSAKDVNEFLGRNKGGLQFDRVDDRMWYSPELDIVIADTKPENFLVVEGKVVPVDIQIATPTPAMRAAWGLPPRHGGSNDSTSGAVRSSPKATTVSPPMEGLPSQNGDPTVKPKPTLSERKAEIGKLLQERPERRAYVSDAFSGYAREGAPLEEAVWAQTMQKATLLADYAHDDGDLPYAQIITRVDSAEGWGQYYRVEAGKNPWAQIGVRTDIPFPLMVALHEMGHHVAELLGVDAVTAVAKAAWKTETKKKIVARGEKVGYLLDPHEIFSRVYAQYVLTQSQNSEALAEMKAILALHNRHHVLWPPKEFARLRDVLEIQLKQVKWL